MNVTCAHKDNGFADTIFVTRTEYIFVQNVYLESEDMINVTEQLFRKQKYELQK